MGKTLVTLAGLLVLLIAIAVSLKIFFITPVSPVQICRHAFELLSKESLEKTGRTLSVAQLQQMSGVLEADCVREVSIDQKNKVQGLIRTTKISKCQIAAQTMSDFEACNSSYSR
jgi:hypothetical protein